MNPTQLPKIAITMGDAAGIGPEVLLKALVHPDCPKDFIPLVLGDAGALRERQQLFGLPGKIIEVSEIPNQAPPQGEIWVFPVGQLNQEGFELGIPHAGAGELAFQAIVKAVEWARQGLVDALVTAPICKESLHLAGHHYDGHTGLIAELCQTKDYRMTFATDQLKILHVTAHMSLKDAISKITQERVLKTILIGQEHLVKLGIPHPRIAVCGLNPHAGENGIFGREDLDQIEPAVKAAQAMGIQAFGPLPGDTTFMHAFNGRFDIVIAQYHDQGHIPGKLVAFDRGVNVTLGLPIIRTSVDHGTAFDIVKQGTAGYANFYCALKYALDMCRGKGF